MYWMIYLKEERWENHMGFWCKTEAIDEAETLHGLWAIIPIANAGEAAIQETLERLNK